MGFLLAAAAEAGAMNFTLGVEINLTVHASGPIEEGDAANFAALPKFDTLELDSPGGLVGEALAMAFQDGQPVVVLDWKSDVAPSKQDTRDHAAQLSDYLRATGVSRGAVVYMTSGVIRWVSASTSQVNL
jgi:hypothetical protein